MLTKIEADVGKLSSKQQSNKEIHVSIVNSIRFVVLYHGIQKQLQNKV